MRASSSKQAPTNPSTTSASRQGNVTLADPAGPSTPVELPQHAPNTNRKGGVAGLAADARSLLAPGFLTSSYKPPIRPAASPSVTSALSTSPIGLSPSRHDLDADGGAAARLRRVASNASISTMKREISPNPLTQIEPAQASAADEASVPKPGPPPPASLQEEESESHSRLAVPEVGMKRPLPTSHHPSSQMSRSPSRRKTWFGWTATAERSEAAADTIGGTDDNPATPQETVDEVVPTQKPVAEAIHTTSNTLRETSIDQTHQNSGRQSYWGFWRATPTDPISVEGASIHDHTRPDQHHRQLADQKVEHNQDAIEGTLPKGELQPTDNGDQPSLPAQSGSLHENAEGNTQLPQRSEGQQPRSWSYWPGTWYASADSAPQKQTPVSTSATEPSKQLSSVMPESAATAAEPDQAAPQELPSLHTGEAPASSLRGWTSWIPYLGQSTAASSPTPTPTPTPTPPSFVGGPSQGGPEDVDPRLTPAEEVKKAALARPEPSAPSVSSPSLDPSTAVLNTATRNSWLAYFASRGARPVQRIEANEPEAMEIDFTEMTGGSHPSVATNNPNGKAVWKASRDLQSAPSAKKESSSTTSSLKAVDRASVKPDPAPPVSRPTTPMTGDKGQAKEVVKKSSQQNKKGPPSSRPRVPNLVLPSFDDTFRTLPRSLAPPAGVLKRTLSAVNAWLSSSPPDAARLRTAPRLGKNVQKDEVGLALAEQAAVRLPRAWDVVGQKNRSDKRGCNHINRVVIVACHGWFAQSKISQLMGTPTGTSQKLALEMRAAVMRHFHSVEGMELNPEAITLIPLSADGTVEVRTDASFAALLGRKDWVTHLTSADAIFVACHSQGCIVGANLLARLIEQSYIHPKKTRIALLAMCGINEGPFQHIQSMLVSSYLTYFETEAAKELFAFQSSTSNVSRRYQASMRLMLEAGAKVILIASTDDQVVPLHSALFTSIEHPSILRALYIHGHTFPKLDFLTNVLTFCVRVRNAGLSDHQLLTLLSNTVAGSLYGGAGHSLCYDEPKAYDLATRYLFETTHPLSEPTTRSDESHPPKLETLPFEAPSSRRAQLNNPHLLPWSLRGLLEDRAVRAIFNDEIQKLHDDFESWQPQTKTLKDVQYRLEPMRSIVRPKVTTPSPSPSNSKL